MAARGLLQYLRLKAIVSLLRFINYVFTRSHFTPSATCRREPVRIPSRQHGRFISAWLYYPPDHKQDEPRAVVNNWHGGGFILPNLGMDHGFCERVARGANLVVLDADYRKGPEHPFPAAAQDAEDVLRWVGSQPRLFDADRVALSGFSSGGTLALVAASELRRELDGVNVRAVYAFYPGTDLSIAPEDRRVAHPIRPMSVFALNLFAESYIPRLEDRKSPRASPMYAETSSFPAHVFLVACSGDVLSPETEAFGEKLARAGQSVEVVKVDNAAHGFDKAIIPRHFKPEERDKTYSKVIKSLNSIM
ncbi:hypothetical protein HIM_07649 [Hirsutella minnesotensis 3608]|uniref:Alpha/beta hydrolase fold-3 domain-containing protein n=1 Tax=Hirsutella minnesotensis 3608 TaxID=1043627 RepID=A0A0F7ZHM2_9HYPO|nr:hypothetical protein HIM_07649 [Hirsutella minnesotensis 3608]